MFYFNSCCCCFFFVVVIFVLVAESFFSITFKLHVFWYTKMNPISTIDSQIAIPQHITSKPIFAHCKCFYLNFFCSFFSSFFCCLNCFHYFGLIDHHHHHHRIWPKKTIRFWKTLEINLIIFIHQHLITKNN